MTVSAGELARRAISAPRTVLAPVLAPAVRPLLEPVRLQLQSAVRAKVAGADFEDAHAAIWDEPGPRWYAPEDPIWRVHTDASMFVGGIRALLMQSLHPVAMAAVAQHSGFRGDPWGRLQRTSRYIATTTYGSIDAAQRSIAAVRAVHHGISGRTEDGVAYTAEDPHLLMWVHVAEIESFLVAHQAFGRMPLTTAEADSYVEQAGHAAELLGVVDPPGSYAELREQIATFRDELGATRAAEAAKILLAEPLPSCERM